jgi:pimeloyl-ACP methyl ester carboxylesterase
MDTESAARDLDHIRAALGEERLNFIGFSYGTLLGATYATLFPERTGALVLDSAVAPGLTLTDALTARAASRDDSLARFFAACAADQKCDLGGGSDAATVAARFDALVSGVRASGPIPAGDRALGATDLALAINEGLRSAKWLPFGDALARAEAGDGKALLARADAAALRRPDGSYETAFLGLLAVGCLEQPLAPGETLTSLQALVAGFSPGAASASVPYALCAGWPWIRPRPAVVIAAPTAPPALVISSRHDPITPYAEGATLVGALGNGSHLLTHEGGGHIASFQNACVRAEITRFLLSPSAIPATSCAEE